MTADRARRFAWFWAVLCVLAMINLILQMLVAAAPVRFVVSMLFVALTGWQAQRYWRRSADLDVATAAGGAEPSTEPEPPPPGAGFAERLAWAQAQPTFKRTWIYLVVVSVALLLASVVFFVLATQQGLGGMLALAIIWLVPGVFFTVMTWRTRPGAGSAAD